ncbi:MAG: serine hydrolase, partial [Candidatus Aminicenantales bacterium]
MKNHLRKAYLFLFIALWMGLGSLWLAAEESLPSAYSEAIRAYEEFISRQMALDKVPGVSVGFMKDAFIWTKGFGYADLENMVPAKPESSYRLASITKTITAIAVLQLVEAGKIDLDAEVQIYVPYFPRKKWPVTVRLLLGHLGGISHYRNDEVEGHIKVHKNTKEALAIFQDFDLIAQPGTKYHYSTYGYNLLGAVVEGASGMPYGEYIKKNIFEPLGMENSRMDDPVDLIPHRVRGYRLINGEIKNSEYVDISSRFAGGGTRSTVVDLLKYAKGIIEGKLLKKETWNQMFSSMAIQQGLLTGYGMGWGLRPLRGHFMVSHGGSQPETRTYLLILPTEKFAIAFASNLEGMNRMLYVRRLAELVLDEDVDGAAYVDGREGQIIHDACFRVFSYGMSRLDWLGRPLAEDEEDLEKAFAYFNTYVDKGALKRQYRIAKKKIMTGIHPLSDRAFTKVGTFMAATLKEALGEEEWRNYPKKGPIPFFSDYIQISRKWSSERKNFRFKNSFARLIDGWEKDWSRVYTDSIRRLFISADTDFDALSAQLRQAFAGATIYPDFTQDIARVSRSLLQKDELEKSFKALRLSVELYPLSPMAWSSLAEAHLWKGEVDEARRLFKKAHAIDPEHPSTGLNSIFQIARSLEQAKKLQEIFALMDIATEIHPKNARLYKEIADMYLRTGHKNKAAQFYRKALS